MRRLQILLLLFSARIVVGVTTCLPDAIPEEDRQNVVVDGESMPLGIWTSAFDSSTIVSKIYEIIAQERLGYNTLMDFGSASKIQVFKLAGCDHDPIEMTSLGNCGPPRRYHISLEFWYASSPWWSSWAAEMGDYTPVNLGSIGYPGKEGMFILDQAVQKALTERGLALEYYRSYNATWYNPALYASVVADVSLNQLQTCGESVEGYFPDIATVYLGATGDVDGVEEVNGKTVLKCWQDKWWAAPACRHNISGCVTVISGGPGWGWPEMIQQAFFHNMPLAFATAQKEPVDHYIPLNRQLQSLLYWWTPDTKFTLDNPSQIIFPPNSPSEYANQIFKTQRENVDLTNWAAVGVEAIADRAVAVARNLFIADDELSSILVRHLSATPPDPWQTACNWLKANSAVWMAWLPNETACTAGKGLVNSLGELVVDRSLAVSCQVCPVGTSSMEQGSTQVCLPCAEGTFQNLPGESTCIPCELGRFADATGAGECSVCDLGGYANDTGMTACFKCGANTTQMDQWTTSKAVMNQEKITWIPVQGAVSESYCGCVEGTYYHDGLCRPCDEGSICSGSSRIELLPGYFSPLEDPGSIYRCFGQPERCPGGPPGTCASGRDTSSIACSSCLPGLHAKDGVCVECVGGDYALIVSVAILVIGAIAVLYIVLMNEGQKSRQPGSLLIAALGMGQMVTVVQQLTVIQQFKIEWGEPFSSVLVALEVMAFDMDMISISCVAPMSPVVKFATRTLLVLVFFFVAAVVHAAFLTVRKAKGLQLSLLARTVGTLFMVFFISLCSSLLAPFRCNGHPNGLSTVQAYHGVFCNGRDEHLQMALIGGFACLLPIAFLVLCSWIILHELPKRLESADVQFVRACSFLFVRFRPGAEVFSVIFLVRNSLVVLCPLLPSTSGKVLCLNLLLYVSLVVTAFSKPWRAMACNYLDIVLVTGMLVILDMGSLFVGEVDAEITVVICMLFSSLMVAAILGAILYGIVKHFMQKYRKPFRFFLCHQKVAAGSYARLLKMELQKRGSRFTTFVDCDDLNDLTRLFSYVGQDTETFVILGSQDILTRKWCVGEMVTARIQKVNTVLLMWPSFLKPDKVFIENYTSIVPDITELANYNIGIAEVEETLRWINTVEALEVPALLSTDTIDQIVSGLTQTSRTRSISDQKDHPDCLILADLENMEAAATAYILLALIVPKLMGASSNSMPQVLQQSRDLPPTAKSALVICSDGCFRSCEMAQWLLQVSQIDSCAILPIIAEDGFRFPTQSFYDDLSSYSQLEKVDLRTYVRVIKTVFQEIAVVFSPQNYSSTQEDLELRAKQVAWRLQSGALKSVSSKLAGKEGDDEEMTASDGLKEGVLSAEPLWPLRGARLSGCYVNALALSTRSVKIRPLRSRAPFCHGVATIRLSSR
eukprot:s4992_g3.t2